MANTVAKHWLEQADVHAVFGERISFERDALAAGRQRIAGVDEAGRGPLAGPIVAAAVVLGGPVEGVDDSKRLSASRRESLYAQLVSGLHHVGVHIVEAAEIDMHGIQASNYAAMLYAALRIDPEPDFLLVDGFEIKGCSIPQEHIVKGDQRSISIAAASIIAKVTRDRIMIELDETYPEYGFAQHKGYGTRQHLDAIKKFGPCDAHRKSFAPMAASRESGSLFSKQEPRA